MDKQQRRLKRRERKQTQDEERARKLKGRKEIRKALLELYKLACVRYPSLVGVYEFDSELNLTGQEPLNHFGLGSKYKVVYLDLRDDDGYGSFNPVGGNIVLGGFAQIISDQEENRSSIVFMRRSKVSPHLSDFYNIPLFFHEMGHVDDIAKRLHLVEGRVVDMEAAEFHAHEYACHRMMEVGPLSTPYLELYLNDAIEKLAAASVPTIANAAKRFKESETYAKARDLVAADNAG